MPLAVVAARPVVARAAPWELAVLVATLPAAAPVALWGLVALVVPRLWAARRARRRAGDPVTNLVPVARVDCLQWGALQEHRRWAEAPVPLRSEARAV